MDTVTPRLATVDDADEVARLLHDFNTEFDTPTPGPEVLAARLRSLLAGEWTIAVLAGTPAVGLAVGLAVVTLRPNVWHDGPVALLDELYVVPDRRGQRIGSAIVELLEADLTALGVELVEINVDEQDAGARRFYERHGYSAIEPDTGEHALYYWRTITG